MRASRWWGGVLALSMSLAGSSQAAPVVVFQDDFERTGPIGAAWSVPRGWFTTNGSAAVATSAQSYAFWTSTPGDDDTASVRLATPLKPTYAGVIVRAATATPDRDHYAAYVGPDGRVHLARRNGWTYTYLADGPAFPVGSHVLSLTASHPAPVQLTVAVDGVAVIDVADGSSAALGTGGRAGIFDYNGAGQPIDQFSVTSTSGAGLAFDDAFSRTGGLGPDWRVVHGAFSANGSAAQGTAAQSYAVWTGSASADDVAEVTLATPLRPTYVGAFTRGASTAPDRDHYAAYVSPDGRLHLARRNGWTYTYLADGPVFPSGSHALSVSARGAAPVMLSVRLDGVEVIRFADDSSAALVSGGPVGMFDYNGAGQPIDRFRVVRPPAPGRTRWIRSLYQQQGAPDVAVSASGDLFVSRGPPAAGQLQVQKFDSSGVDVWTAGLPFDVSDPQVEVTPLGNIFLADQATPDSTRVVKLDPNGAMQWTLLVPGERRTLAVDSHGAALVDTFDAAGHHLTKIRYDGVVLWNRALPMHDFYPFALAADPSDRVIVGGRGHGQVVEGDPGSYVDGADDLPFVLQMDGSDGHVLWLDALTGVTSGLIARVGVSAVGTVVATARYTGTVTWAGQTFSEPGSTVAPLLLVAESNGAPRFGRALPNAYADPLLAMDPSGAAVVVQNGRYETSVVKYDLAGEMRWARSFHGWWDGLEINGIAATPGHEAVLAGTWSGALQLDGFTLTGGDFTAFLWELGE